MKKIEDFLNDRLPHAGLLPHSLMHSVAPLVLGLFVACLVTLSCNTSDVLIESFELLLLFDLLFMILSRYSFQYVVFKVRGTPQAKLLSANGDGEIRTLDPLLAMQVLSQLSYTPKVIWHPPALPCRLQHSTIGRLGLNRRVRDGNGCVPQPHRHRKYQNLLKSESFLIGSPKSFAFSRSRLRRLCSQVHQSAPESKLSSLLSDPVRAITHDSRRFNSI